MDELDFLYLKNKSYYGDSEKIEIDNKDGWNVMHWNINGLKNKIDDVNLLLDDLQKKNVVIDVIMFCETHLNIDDNLPQICNYESVHYVRQTPGGGVSIYILSQYKYKENKKYQKLFREPNESIFLEVDSPNELCKKKILLGEIYRRPVGSPDIYITDMQKLLSQIKNIYKHVYIGTDQNINFLDTTKNIGDKLLNVVYENDIIPTVEIPTRCTYTTDTLIDNIYIDIKDCDSYECIVIKDKTSDHYPCLLIHYNKEKILEREVYVKSRKLNDAKYKKIIDKLQLVNWNELINDDKTIDECYDNMIGKINEILDEIAPEKLKRLKKKNFFS